jgi:hypothetical protein
LRTGYGTLYGVTGAGESVTPFGKIVAIPYAAGKMTA